VCGFEFGLVLLLALARWSQTSCSMPTFCCLVTDPTKLNAASKSSELELWKL